MAQKNGAVKLAKLRQLMKNVRVGGIEGKGIQALIVNSEDAHQSEYICARDKRRCFISGFGGSLGTAIITMDKALLWTDGRYFLQASQELDPPEAWTLMKEGLLNTPTTAEWLLANLPPKSTVGADPNLLSYNEWVPLHTSLSGAGHCLLPLEENLVDEVWGDEQPSAVANPIIPQPIQFSGRTAGNKIDHCRKVMEKNAVTILVISALDDIAYLLNLRGSDIPFCPVFFAYIVLTLKEIHIFVDTSRITNEAQEQLKEEGVELIYHSYQDIHPFLRHTASQCSEDDKIWISNTVNYAFYMDCGEVRKHIAVTPIHQMKTVKNSAEIDGMKSAHIRDGVALVKYFAWLEDKVKNNVLVTEISGAEQLEKFRQEEELYMGPSFQTISSVGPHGAIIHYTPSAETDVPITNKEMYLCDSGAQYRDGTTDVTRTMHFGEPTDFERECFTRVFKGQCRLSCAIFPLMIKGNYLDTLARESLWSVGLNYLHGTGHSVGSYLYVHELTIGISWRPYPDDPGLQSGIFVSNEPGYYEDQKFGIRLENIELIVPANTPYKFNNKEFLTFETVTLVPIQTRMLDLTLLTDKEIEYLNNYHARCLETLRPLLQRSEDAQALQWLERETKPISR